MTSLVLVRYHTFGCVSCFGKIYKICLMTGWYYVYLSSKSRITDLIVSLRHEWLGLGDGDTN
jgi:hypothetical protein